MQFFVDESYRYNSVLAFSKGFETSESLISSWSRIVQPEDIARKIYLIYVGAITGEKAKVNKSPDHRPLTLRSIEFIPRFYARKCLIKLRYIENHTVDPEFGRRMHIGKCSCP